MEASKGEILNFFEENISQRLASWQHHLLNKVGRMTLVKSVLNSIPYYYMQVAWLPQSTCESIDRLAINFLWKGSSNFRIYLVGWEKITKPKKLGGLEIRKAREANTSLLGRLVWRLHQNCDSLWVKVLTHKYFHADKLLTVTRKSGSVTWNAIMKARFTLRDGFDFRLGDDNSSFWFVNWSGIGKLTEKVLYVDIHDLNLRVKDVFVNGAWNFNHIYTTLPASITDSLKILPICLNSRVTDGYTWKGNLHGIYSAEDGYYWLNMIAFAAGAVENVS